MLNEPYSSSSPQKTVSTGISEKCQTGSRRRVLSQCMWRKTHSRFISGPLNGEAHGAISSATNLPAKDGHPLNLVVQTEGWATRPEILLLSLRSVPFNCTLRLRGCSCLRYKPQALRRRKPPRSRCRSACRHSRRHKRSRSAGEDWSTVRSRDRGFQRCGTGRWRCRSRVCSYRSHRKCRRRRKRPPALASGQVARRCKCQSCMLRPVVVRQSCRSR